MNRRCIVLLSGGLDSMLAVRIMQEQGIEVEAINFRTVFACCQDLASQAARELDVRLTVLRQEDDYLDVIKHPKFGYGRGANPCIDCRAYMFQKAAASMETLGASFIVSGEVLGQRPMSQKRNDLPVIAREAGLEDLLLRPLSAKLLPPTRPEREGIVDREKLYDFDGRSRKGLIELGKQLGLKRFPTPSSGCSLTEPLFSKKVHDLVQLQPDSRRWDFEVLNYGRHVRLDEQTKLVVGKNEEDNLMLEYLFQRQDASASALLRPENFNGPMVLLIGPASEESVRFAGGLVLRYSKRAESDEAPLVELEVRGEEKRVMVAERVAEAEAAATLTTG